MKTILILLCLMIGSFAVESKPTIAIVDFDAKVPEQAAVLADQIRSYISASPKITVLSRDVIAKIMVEQQFQMSGLVNEETQSELGQLIGAQYLLTGKVTKSGINYFLNAQIVETKTGVVVSSGSTFAMSIQLLSTGGCEKVAAALLAPFSSSK